MSNALAVAVVSAVLRARVTSAIKSLAISTVAAEPPRDDSPPGVYLHLYQVTPNAELRNAHLPEHDRRGDLVHPPRLAVDLQYLVSFVGAAESLDAERLAGAVLVEFAQRPRLGGAEIAEVIASLSRDPVLARSDLASQVEAIRVTLVPIEGDELARLWGMYGQLRHRLSVIYRVSVVMLDAQFPAVQEQPVTVPPVVTVVPLRTPRITGVRSGTGERAVVPFGEQIVVSGSALRGERTTVRVGTATVVPTGADLTDVELRVRFDAASSLRAGVVPVQVVHQVVLADGEVREGPTSDASPVALTPVVGAVDLVPAPEDATHVRVELSPVPTEDERAVLHLSAADGTAGTSTQWSTDGARTVFRTTGLPAGTYQVRVEVGGATSLPTTDPATGRLVRPTVTVP